MSEHETPAVIDPGQLIRAVTRKLEGQGVRLHKADVSPTSYSFYDDAGRTGTVGVNERGHAVLTGDLLEGIDAAAALDELEMLQAEEQTAREAQQHLVPKEAK